MKAIALLGLTAAIAAPTLATAQEVDPWQLPAPAVAGGFAMSFGADALSSGWDDALVRAGKPPLLPVMGDLGLRGFLQMEGFELSVQASLLFDARDSGGEPYTSAIAGSVFAEIFYDPFRAPVLTLGPAFGVGWVRSEFCIPGASSTVSDDAPPYEKALASPGRDGACIASEALLVRPGIVLGIAAPLSERPDGNVGFMNLRTTYAIPVRQSKLFIEGEREISGPTPPHASFGFSLEVGVAFGAGVRSTGF